MRNDLRVRVGREVRSLRLEFVAELAKILDDSVVYDCQTIGRMRMGILLAGFSMGGPARVANPNHTVKRIAPQSAFEVAKFALRTPPHQLPAFQGCNPGGIVSAIFEASERIDEMACDRFATEYADNPAHGGSLLLFISCDHAMACDSVTTAILYPACMKRRQQRPVSRRGLAGLFNGTQARRPVFFDNLTLPRDREAGRRKIVGDDGPRRPIRTVTHLHRCNERRIRADEATLADVGAMFCNSVIVAYYGAGSEVRACSQTRIPDIGEVIGLGSIFDHCCFD